MTDSLLLSPEQLAELTGHPYAAHQIKWLARNGWKFEVGGDGLPKVARFYFDERMGVKARRKSGPNLGALRTPVRMN